ncbi:MAG: acyl-CoA dehydrogenase [Bacteroidetes bacterium 4572_128]|nr:MAG: acyl-CoA dehydrogenase [Bacteroidetes bacterium 4572_128]
MANFYTDNKDIKFHLSHPLMKRIVELKERSFSDKNKYDYANINFEDTIDNYDKIIEIVGEISGEIISKNAEIVDKEGAKLINDRVFYADGTQENYNALVKAGLTGMTIPRKYNGLNFPIVPYIMVGEIISRADAGFANIWGLQDCGETLHDFASEELKDEFLPRFSKGETGAMSLTEPDAGSDLQAVGLQAHFDEKKNTWFLNGVKRFITNGDADISLVLARSEKDTKDGRGLSLFVYEKKDNATIIRRLENKLGIKGSPTCEIVFKDAPAKLVGNTRMGLIKYVMSLMNAARLGVGGQSIGISEAAYREAKKYANERSQFNKKIIEFPQVYEMLKLMKVKIQSQRSLLYETARFTDMYKILTDISKERKLTPAERKEMKFYKRLSDAYTPVLKLMASEMSNQITYDAMQVHGGTGYMKDFSVERLYRDARITSIYEGTSQLQVVAAIRNVTSNFYLSQIKNYEKEVNKEEFFDLKDKMIKMTNEFQDVVEKVKSKNNIEFLDFHSRRLVEMAGNIIVSYLFVIDSMRDENYKKNAEIFIKKVYAENKEKANYIYNFEINDLENFKI